MMFSTEQGAERDAPAIPQPDWEWSKDPEIWPKQWKAALAAKGFRRPQTKKKGPSRQQSAKRSKPQERSEDITFWERLPWQEAFVNSLPAYIDCAAAGFAYGTFKRPRDLALNFPLIQFNAPKRKVWLLFDIDRKNAAQAFEAAGVAVPNLIMENPANGHAHIAYQLAVPVTYYEKSRQGSIHWLADIERGMTRRLDADKAFAGHLGKNPLSDWWRVHWRRGGAYSLAELASHLKPQEMRGWAPGEREAGLGRNCSLFDWLRELAYKEVLHLKRAGATCAAFLQKLFNAALDRNRTAFLEPLPVSEVACIARSVANWTWKHFTLEAFSKRQRARISKRWAGHISLDATRPWEAEGISRRTWFYRKARAAAEKER